MDHQRAIEKDILPGHEGIQCDSWTHGDPSQFSTLELGTLHSINFSQINHIQNKHGVVAQPD